MGNWVNINGQEIPVRQMEDSYIRNLIGFIAHGGGWNSRIVLGFVDDLYSAAKSRNILRGFPAMTLKAYTKRLWKRIAKKEKTGVKYAWRTPKWVDWMVKKYCPRKDY